MRLSLPPEGTEEINFHEGVLQTPGVAGVGGSPVIKRRRPRFISRPWAAWLVVGLLVGVCQARRAGVVGFV